MKSAWKFSQLSRRSNSRIFHLNASSLSHSNPTPSLPVPYSERAPPVSDQSPPLHPPTNSPLLSIASLFDGSNDVDSNGPKRRQKLPINTSNLRDQILACNAGSDSRTVSSVLDDELLKLCKRYRDGSAFAKLLDQLLQWPPLALEVINWRRKLDDASLPMTAYEYCKSIAIAGKVKNVKLADELFEEAAKGKMKTTLTYNALMGAYMVNGLTTRCRSLFQSFKSETCCRPTIVTYNMLISVIGSLLLVDQMEATLDEIKKLNLKPTLKTYNYLITGYLRAWMWDRMENTYLAMKASSIEPDTETYLLMFRGYSYSGNVVKMEEMYEFLNETDYAEDADIVITMICAYCKSPSPNRISKIESLRRLIPEAKYKPWLNVLLIKAYAQEGLIEKMEDLINVAIERRTCVETADVMIAIARAFVKCNALDKLAEFVSRAEYNGWKLSRAVYHCKMIMYGSRNRLMEMESVLSEMDRVNIDCNYKTLKILYCSYKLWGQTHRLDQIIGLMWKLGFEIPVDDDKCISEQDLCLD